MHWSWWEKKQTNQQKKKNTGLFRWLLSMSGYDLMQTLHLVSFIMVKLTKLWVVQHLNDKGLLGLSLD